MKGPLFESGRQLIAICRDLLSSDEAFSEGLRGPPEVYVSEVLRRKRARARVEMQ
jgi:hypothetical protein